MNEEDTPLARWCVVIVALSTERGWALSADDIERYLCALRKLLPATCSPAELRRVCAYYHADHELVEALQQPSHPYHSEGWRIWMRQVPEILRKAGVDWSSDGAMDSDDLAQVALMELLASLSSFRYQSSFVTWAHTVAVQSVRRRIRDSRAKKRAQRPDSLDELPDFDAPARAEEEPEQQSLDQALMEQIDTTLAECADARLSLIFHLWAVEDRSTEQIGRLVHLHPSRVRALLAQARTILRQHPAIHLWLDELTLPRSDTMIK